MEFTYFRASPHEMSDYVRDGKQRCSLCGSEGDCFRLSSARCPEIPRGERDEALGCYHCLRAGRFEFTHDTEAGMLDENGLQPFPGDEEDEIVYAVDPSGHVVEVRSVPPLPPPTITAAALVELRRTPEWSSWQQSHWLCHCHDFMVYLGEWAVQDFHEHAPDGNGRGLFLSMTDSDLVFIWPDDEATPDWGVSYYAFCCRRCGTFRGYWDST